jgi:LmbE family N-acetylglucosaminyl deacetylase
VAATLSIGAPGRPLSILCLGAHCDDIEIGCGGTLLRLLAERPGSSVHWVVFSSSSERASEARASADEFLAGARDRKVEVNSFRERYFPYLPELKEYFDGLGRSVMPDVIFTHWEQDRHQDHRVVAELTANTFRDHPVLAYEIPKYDADLGRPNVFVSLDRATLDTKVSLLMDSFRSQRSKPWFTRDLFEGLARLRGVECASPTGYAEAFHASKLVLG